MQQWNEVVQPASKRQPVNKTSAQTWWHHTAPGVGKCHVLMWFLCDVSWRNSTVEGDVFGAVQFEASWQELSTLGASPRRVFTEKISQSVRSLEVWTQDFVCDSADSFTEEYSAVYMRPFKCSSDRDSHGKFVVWRLIVWTEGFIWTVWFSETEYLKTTAEGVRRLVCSDWKLCKRALI
jgi:hypothetical protein